MSRFEVYGLFFAVVLGASMLTTAGSAAFSRLRARPQSWMTAVVALAFPALLWFRPAGLPLSNAAVLVVSVAVGTRIGRGLRSRGALLAFAATASIIDIVSFTAGPTRWLLGVGDDSAWAGIRYLAVSLSVSDRVVPVVGVGDLLILAALFTGLRGLRLPALASMSVLWAGLVAALAVGLVIGGAFGIPFMAAAAGLYLWVTSRSQGETGPSCKRVEETAHLQR